MCWYALFPGIVGTILGSSFSQNELSKKPSNLQPNTRHPNTTWTGLAKKTCWVSLFARREVSKTPFATMKPHTFQWFLGCSAKRNILSKSRLIWVTLTPAKWIIFPVENPNPANESPAPIGSNTSTSVVWQGHDTKEFECRDAPPLCKSVDVRMSS